MLRNKKRMISILSTITVLGIMSVNVSASVVPKRIAGEDRVKTSIAVASENWTKSDYAVIAYAWNFPDAVSASPLAFKYNAPILLTDKESLNAETDSKLSNLKVKHVFIVGGTGVVSEKVEAQIKAKGIDVQRISGKNRYETSIAIAKQVGTSSSIVVTNGYTPFDAMSIASIASKKGMPIILTDNKTVPEAVVNYLKQSNITQSYILGKSDGTASDDGVADNSVFPNPIRITGANLYERNINILKKFDADINYSKAYIATGKSFADALAGSALAAITSSPVIFVDENMPQVTRKFIASKSSFVTNIFILGGTGAVSVGTALDVETLLATGTAVTLADGKYVGDMKNDMANGQGTFTYENGNKYVGQFKDDKFNGKGTFTYSNGDQYIGQFKDDEYNGQGTFTYANGDKYVGEFKDDEYNGQGTFRYANGDKYVGQFKDDEYNGQGTFTYASGDQYVGQFKDAECNGQGTFTNVNGDIYVGEFKDNKANGQGVLTCLDRNKYVGEFKNDEFNGQGTFTSASGEVVQGLWKDSEYIGN